MITGAVELYVPLEFHVSVIIILKLATKDIKKNNVFLETTLRQRTYLFAFAGVFTVLLTENGTGDRGKYYHNPNGRSSKLGNPLPIIPPTGKKKLYAWQFNGRTIYS